MIKLHNCDIKLMETLNSLTITLTLRTLRYGFVIYFSVNVCLKIILFLELILYYCTLETKCQSLFTCGKDFL